MPWARSLSLLRHLGWIGAENDRALRELVPELDKFSSDVAIRGAAPPGEIVTFARGVDIKTGLFRHDRTTTPVISVAV